MDQPRGWIAALLIAGLLTQGCSRPDPDPAREGAEVLEEGGVRTVVSHAPVHPAGHWSVADAPRLQIGEVEGEEPYLFQSVNHAHVEPNGEIVVVDAAASRIRVYSPNGDHLGSRGRTGGGPAEFRDGLAAARRMTVDTLVLVDRSGRIHVAPSDGEVVRSWTPELLPVLTLLEHGRFVRVVTTSPLSLPSGHHEMRRHVTLGTLDAPTEEDTVATFSAGGRMITRTEGGGFWSVGVPFASGDAYVVDVLGGRLIHTEGHDLVIHSLEEGTVIRARLGAEPRPVASEDWDRAVSAELEEEERRTSFLPEPPADLERQAEQYAAAPRPTHMPSFDDLRVDGAGSVWARRYVPPWEADTDVRKWSVFDASGRWVTDVDVPTELRLLEIGTSHIVARWEDELGVQRVRVYDLDESDS